MDEADEINVKKLNKYYIEYYNDQNKKHEKDNVSVDVETEFGDLDITKSNNHIVERNKMTVFMHRA